MAVKGRGNQRKRSAATRDEPTEKAEEVFGAGKIDVPSDPEDGSQSDNTEEGDFDTMLQEMADDQGFGSDDPEDYAEGEDEEGEDEEGSIHSSDIEGASSEEDEESADADSEDAVSDDADSEDADSDDDQEKDGEDESRATDGQDTAVDSGDDLDSAVLDGGVMEKLTIRDFGKDLGSWKEYRKTLPQIDPGYASDSSTEEPANTIGDVPIEWYADYPHIGYDIDGKRVMRPATGDELDKFLANMDDPDVFRTARDEVNQRDVKLSEEEIDIIRRIQGGTVPDAEFNPYEDTVEWFTSQTMQTPLTAAPPSKMSFLPSKWEHKRVMKIVRAIRQGRITRAAPKDSEPKFYDLWADAAQGEDTANGRRQRLAAPRMALPTHAESYHPPAEYLPTEAERREWLDTDPDARKRNFLPQDFSSLRAVPGYDRFMQERFQRCLDLYLAPRVLKKKSHLDAEELTPKLPDPRDLRPFPAVEALV
ncbi:Ribosome biogenesis protein erb1, partial [Coemansia sp. RSA 2618]